MVNTMSLSVERDPNGPIIFPNRDPNGPIIFP